MKIEVDKTYGTLIIEAESVLENETIAKLYGGLREVFGTEDYRLAQIKNIPLIERAYSLNSLQFWVLDPQGRKLVDLVRSGEKPKQ